MIASSLLVLWRSFYKSHKLSGHISRSKAEMFVSVLGVSQRQRLRVRVPKPHQTQGLGACFVHTKQFVTSTQAGV